MDPEKQERGCVCVCMLCELVCDVIAKIAIYCYCYYYLFTSRSPLHQEIFMANGFSVLFGSFSQGISLLFFTLMFPSFVTPTVTMSI